MIIGGLIEGTATCLCRLMSRGLNDANVRGATVLDSFFATMLVVLGIYKQLQTLRSPSAQELDQIRDQRILR